MLAVVPAGFTETLVAGGLTSPTTMVAAPDGHMFIAQQDGTILVAHDDVVEEQPFATLTVDSQGERGLLGITLDPNFENNGYVYVHYTATTPTSHNRLSRLTAFGDQMLPGSEVVLFEMPSLDDVGHPIYHMGGSINFSPIDGKLYVSVGDHWDTSNPQSLSNPFGKILRLNPDGSIPTDNPFYSSTTGINKAIYAYGLRNPYTSAIQPETGLYYINDVGQDDWEEINQGIAGANYGWPTTEGNFDQSQFPNLTEPVYTYSHDEGCSIVGGTFYPQDSIQFPAQYEGVYFFEDFCSGWIRYFDPANPTVVSTFATGIDYPVGMTVGADGSLYYFSRGGDTNGSVSEVGALYKISYTASVPPHINGQPRDLLVSVGYPASFTASATGSSPLAYQWQRSEAGSGVWSDIPNATSATFQIAATSLNDDGDRFRLQVTNGFGSATSAPATLSVTSNLPPVPTITLPTLDTMYSAGQTFTFAGTANDNEDGALPASAYTWQIDFHHHTHSHPFVPPTSGITTGNFTIPVSGESDADVWYRINLTVTDSVGLTSTTFRDIFPNTVDLTLASNVPGIQLILDGQPKVTPYTVEGVVGVLRSLSAPNIVTVNNQAYEFVGWVDGGAQSRVFSTPTTDTTFTANYDPVNITYLSDLPFAGNPINGWGPVERDRSNGEDQAGDGGSLILRGTTYAKGLGVHANSDVTFNLAGAYTRFLADLGLDNETVGQGSIVFQVFADGTQVYDSGTVFPTTPVQVVDLDVSGVNQLRLVVTDAGDDINFDHGDWANALLLSPATVQSVTYLSDLPFVGTPVNGWGPVERDRSNGEQGATDGNTLSIRGTNYAKGLGVHATSQMTFNLAGAYTTFLADLGIDDETGGNGSVAFQVLADGVSIYNSGTILGTSAVRPVNLNVTGVNQLQLNVSQATNGIDYDHADWANARLVAAAATQPPAAPSGLAASAAGSTQIDLSWIDNSTTETGFQIDRSPNGTTGWTQVGTVGGNVTTYTNTGLTASTTYYYRVRAVNSAGPSANSNVASATTAATQSVTYLSDLPFVGTPVNGWGPVERDRSNGEQGATDGNTLSIRGTNYAKGLGVHATSQMTFNLAGAYTTFLADLGIDDETGGNGSVAFQVLADGVSIYNSGTILGTSAVRPVNLNVTGVNQLQLNVSQATNGIDYDHADWANARLVAAAAPLALATSLSAPTPQPTSKSSSPRIASPATTTKRVAAPPPDRQIVVKPTKSPHATKQIAQRSFRQLASTQVQSNWRVSDELVSLLATHLAKRRKS